MLYNSQMRIYVDKNAHCIDKYSDKLAHSPLNNHSPDKHQRPSMYNNVKIASIRDCRSQYDGTHTHQIHPTAEQMEILSQFTAEL